MSHNNCGLVGKYLVLKRDGDRWAEKRTPCFVLSPEKRDAYGFASCVALYAYATTIKSTNRKLAADLLEWVARVHPTLPKMENVEELMTVLRGLRIPGARGRRP